MRNITTNQFQFELQRLAGKPKWEAPAAAVDPDVLARVQEQAGDLLAEATLEQRKLERREKVSEARGQAAERVLGPEPSPEERAAFAAAVDQLIKTTVRRRIAVEKRRPDGRAADEIRPISVEVGVLPRAHGSGLFTRGQTQALTVATLGASSDVQRIDTISPEESKRYLHHYNFPPYSTGENKPMRGPSRRDIGHGALAERALVPVVPSQEDFPYTIRVVSDILESNGSSSMASVCGASLALMDAGVPLKSHVAGIAMGLVKEGERAVILSDILGSEDHHGDMDFKVAGSGVGITALQMDIKIKGVSRALLEQALEQARMGRKHILRKMLEVVPRPMEQISQFAPRMETVRIPAEKIGYLIGPGGRNIKAMQEQYKVRISIVDDTGTVQVAGLDRAKVHACIDAIKAMTETPKIGTRYTGTVKSIKDFGAFIEILPGVEGLYHISELDEGYVNRVTDVVQLGDQIEVEIINVDDRGKIKLSRKAVLLPAQTND